MFGMRLRPPWGIRICIVGLYFYLILISFHYTDNRVSSQLSIKLSIAIKAL